VKKNVDNVNLAERLKEVQKHSGLSVQKFAKSLNYSKTQMYKFLNGEVNTPSDLGYMLFPLYGIKMEWWETGTGPMTVTPDEATPAPTTVADSPAPDYALNNHLTTDQRWLLDKTQDFSADEWEQAYSAVLEIRARRKAISQDDDHQTPVDLIGKQTIGSDSKTRVGFLKKKGLVETMAEPAGPPLGKSSPSRRMANGEG
jgi:transcriptional regulator with XRE-family HTH domain